MPHDYILMLDHLMSWNDGKTARMGSPKPTGSENHIQHKTVSL